MPNTTGNEDSQDSVTTSNQNSRPPIKQLSEMNYSDQMETVRRNAVMQVQTTATFHTKLIRRKFRQNFYRWAIQFVEHSRELRKEVAQAQDEFIQKLEALKNPLSDQGYAKWLDMKPRPYAQELEVLIFHPSGTYLQRTFLKADGLLSPVYSAHLAGKLSKEEFEDIKQKVEKDFDFLSKRIEVLLNSSKRR